MEPLRTPLEELPYVHFSPAPPPSASSCKLTCLPFPLRFLVGFAQYVLPAGSVAYIGAVGKDELSESLRAANEKVSFKSQRSRFEFRLRFAERASFFRGLVFCRRESSPPTRSSMDRRLEPVPSSSLVTTGESSYLQLSLLRSSSFLRVDELVADFVPFADPSPPPSEPPSPSLLRISLPLRSRLSSRRPSSSTSEGSSSPTVSSLPSSWLRLLLGLERYVSNSTFLLSRHQCLCSKVGVRERGRGRRWKREMSSR